MTTVTVRSTESGSVLWEGPKEELEQVVEFFQSQGTNVTWQQACACGRGPVGNLGTHCLQCELEPYGVAWELEQEGRL